MTEVASRAGVPIEGPNPDESFWIDQLDSQGRMFGLRGERRFTPDRWLHGGYEVTVGEMRFEVRQCTGHTPGHVIFANTTFGGDVLFKGSIGRTDFPRQTTQQPLRRRRGAGAGAA